MQSDRILLILMPATIHFEANTWRTTEAIDERLMKGFPETSFSKSTSLRLFLPASGAGPWARKTTSSEVPTRSSNGQTARAFSVETSNSPKNFTNKAGGVAEGNR